MRKEGLRVESIEAPRRCNGAGHDVTGVCNGSPGQRFGLKEGEPTATGSSGDGNAEIEVVQTEFANADSVEITSTGPAARTTIEESEFNRVAEVRIVSSRATEAKNNDFGRADVVISADE